MSEHKKTIKKTMKETSKKTYSGRGRYVPFILFQGKERYKDFPGYY